MVNTQSVLHNNTTPSYSIGPVILLEFIYRYVYDNVNQKGLDFFLR